MKLTRAALVAILLLSLGLAACEDDEDDEIEASQTVEITVEAFDFYFDPATITLEPSSAATITLVNNGDQLHSFTVPEMDVELEAQGAQTVEGTFAVPEAPGTYNFYCKFHPDEMKGVISVGGLDEPADTDEDPEVVPTETVIVTTPEDEDEAAE